MPTKGLNASDIYMLKTWLKSYNVTTLKFNNSLNSDSKHIICYKYRPDGKEEFISIQQNIRTGRNSLIFRYFVFILFFSYYRL